MVRIEPARVLHVVSAMNRGGAETLLMNVYRHLDRTKLQFDFISHREETCDFDDEIIALGGRIFTVPSLGKSGPIHYIKSLKKIMTATPYTAVHAHTDYQCGFPVFAAKLAGIPRRICHAHSSGWPRGSGIRANVMLKCLQGLMKMGATHYCSCSVEAGRFLFGKRSSTRHKVQIVKNGIAPGLFMGEAADDVISLRQELNIPPGMHMIGHVGKFSESKNQIFILYVLKHLIEQKKSVVALFVGDGPLKDVVEHEARRLQVDRHVRFLGVRDDIPRLMRAFDVFVFPSLFEGFGIAILEAQCAGTPCVVADTVPASTDMGLGLVTYIRLDDDIQAWSDAIVKALAKSKPKADAIIRNIQRLGFDIQKTIPDWLSLYGVHQA